VTTINFNQAIQDAKSVSFEALPDGEYRIRIIESTATTAQSGKPMIKVKMEVTEGPYAPRKVFNQFVLTLENPNAVSIFFRHMKAFGLDEQFFAALGSQGSLDPVASALMGREAYVKLGHREWQGEMRNNCEGFRPATGVPAAGAPGVPGVPNLPGIPGVPATPPPPPAPQVPVATPAPAPVPGYPVAPPAAQPLQPAQSLQPAQVYAAPPPPAPPVQQVPVAPPQAPVDSAVAEMTNQAPPAPVYQAPAYAPPVAAPPAPEMPQAPPVPPAPVQQASATPVAPPPPPQMPI
jgi:hypothetical protein